MNYSDYPETWAEIRAAVLRRAKNADGVSQCECVGECGREHKGTRCIHLQYGRLTTRSRYKVILTTAHLCHDTKCARLDHLKSMCQPCHQVFDLRERQNANLNRKRSGQIDEGRARKAKWKRRLCANMKGTQTKATAKPMPNAETILLPVLLMLGDELNHSSEEIRERLAVKYDIAPSELIRKLRNGKAEFHSNIDLALAYLRGAPRRRWKAVEKVEKKIYRITEYGKSILNKNPSDLTIKDL